MTQQRSKYTPVWEALKSHGSCTITAPPVHHYRIIKAIKKRRDKDLAFLFWLREARRKHKITYKISGTYITFTLSFPLTLDDL